MGEIELSAADDEDLVFGEQPSAEKTGSKRQVSDVKHDDLPKTFVPGQGDRAIAVSQADDFLDGVESELPVLAPAPAYTPAPAPAQTPAPTFTHTAVPAPAHVSVEGIQVAEISQQEVLAERTLNGTAAKNGMAVNTRSPDVAVRAEDPRPVPDVPVLSVSLKNSMNVAPEPPRVPSQAKNGLHEEVKEVSQKVEAPRTSAPPVASAQSSMSQEKAPLSQPAEGAAVRQNSHQLVSTERRSVSTEVELKAKKDAVELFEILLGSAVKGGASDLLLKQGQVPMFRWNGELFPSRNGPRIDGRFFLNLSAALLSEANCQRLNNMTDIDFSYQSIRGGRVRVNIFHQRGDLSLVARLIPSEIPTFEKLEMGRNVRTLVEQKRGLILVTGATGSGKSTTLAAMLDFINSTRTSHIITIEDPIEFVHSDKRSMFNQRELGLDTPSYAQALRSALRQAPDVILVGELRDSETVEVALQAAETGHLVLSTLHTNDAADSLLRILGMAGLDREAVVRAQLADCLRGVVSQRLIKRNDKSGRVAAQEIMVNTANIREKLLKGGHPSLVRDVIAQGGHSGMQSFDQHLAQLVRDGVIEYEEALRNATNRDDFALRYSGVGDGREAS